MIVLQELKHTRIPQAYFSLFLHRSFHQIYQHLSHQALAIVSTKTRKELKELLYQDQE